MATEFFREDKCTRCGECFTRCRYMELTRREARAEIERLIRGEPTRTVLKKCISCYACNAFCPEDAHPYELIISNWGERYQRRGLPARASYLLPYHQPNYREDMEREMPEPERAALERWKTTPPAGEMLYPGCNLMTTPYLFEQESLRELPVSGDWSLCCGEPLYRMGLFEVMKKVARGLSDYYADKKIEKMVFVCPACLNMFRNVLPSQFGAGFDFECEYIVTWLLNRLDSGDLELKRRLSGTVTVHDSCHARLMGDEIMEQTREFYRRLGLTVINMKSHHLDGICCGIAAGCNRYLPQDILKVSRRELKEGEAAGAAEMAIYCTGCYLMLNLARHVVRTRQPLVHTLELLARAMEEPLPRTVEPRTRSMLWNVTRKAFPAMISSARHRIEKIEVKGGGRG